MLSTHLAHSAKAVCDEFYISSTPYPKDLVRIPSYKSHMLLGKTVLCVISKMNHGQFPFLKKNSDGAGKTLKVTGDDSVLEPYFPSVRLAGSLCTLCLACSDFKPSLPEAFENSLLFPTTCFSSALYISNFIEFVYLWCEEGIPLLFFLFSYGFQWPAVSFFLKKNMNSLLICSVLFIISHVLTCIGLSITQNIHPTGLELTEICQLLPPQCWY